MGTHISRVRSIDLDTWTDDHMKEMIRWGNKRANLYWEAQLPFNYVPDESRIANFIRTKYDLKRWVLCPEIPDPATLSDNSGAAIPATANHTHHHPPHHKHVSRHQTSLHNHSGESAAASLMNSKTKLHAPPSVAISGQSSSAAGASLLDVNGGQSTVSQNPKPTRTVAAVAPQPALAPVPAPAKVAPAANVDHRADLKRSILSLYETPHSNPPAPVPGPFATPQMASTTIPSPHLSVALAELSVSKPLKSPSVSENSDGKQVADAASDDVFANVWK